MPNNYPAAGTPQRRHRMDYQNEYRKKNCYHRSVLFDKRKPQDVAIIDGLNALPEGSRTQFIKDAIAEKLAIK